MPDSTTPALLLEGWILRQAPPPGAAWLLQVRDELARAAPAQAVQRAISAVPRRLGRQPLALSAGDLADAASTCSGWRPGRWSVDQAARVLLLLSAATDAEPLAEQLARLSTSADLGELVAFYRGLPLYPDPPAYLAWTIEGLRTSMRTVFEAVAHENPYPAAQFPEAAWNQMVLKALFIESLLHPIDGLDRRSNPALARMLCDYAHERWAAGRVVAYELWRCVGPHADAAAVQDLARVLESGSELDRQAAALALSQSADPAAAALLGSVPDLAGKIAAGQLHWNALHNQAMAA